MQFEETGTLAPPPLEASKGHRFSAKALAASSFPLDDRPALVLADGGGGLVVSFVEDLAPPLYEAYSGVWLMMANSDFTQKREKAASRGAGAAVLLLLSAGRGGAGRS